jgi:hypothetical protein
MCVEGELMTSCACALAIATEITMLQRLCLLSLPQVYRVGDMSIQRIVASAEDEVNVACFHPAVGGGIAYGTKEVEPLLKSLLKSLSFKGLSKTKLSPQ